MKPGQEISGQLSRRAFIRNSTVLAGGLCVTPLSIEASAYVAGSDTLRVGLVGCGGRGTGAAVQCLQTEGAVKLVAMGDVFRDELDESFANLVGTEAVRARVDVPEERKFVGFDAYKHVIDACDVVLLATPPAFRPQHFEAAVRADKHVFMEKPFSSDSPGTRRVLEAGRMAAEKGLTVVAGLQYRYDPGYREMVKRLRDGAIGDIVSMKSKYLIADMKAHPKQPGWTELEYQMRNWHFFNWLWAGAPSGLMIHYTDIGYWVKDAYPVRAQGNGGRAKLSGPEHGDIFDNFYIEYEFADGTTMHSQIRHLDNCWNTTGITFQGTSGTANIRDGIKNARGETLWAYDRKGGNPYQIEIDQLIASIRNGKPINDTEWAALSNQAELMGRMAAHSGQVITWESALNSDIQLVPDNLQSFDSEPPVRPDANGRYRVPVPGDGAIV